MRKFDHLVLAAQDLDRQRGFYARMGFTLTPRARHPFGTANSLVQLQGNFLELLSVADPTAISKAAPGSFSFGDLVQLEKRWSSPKRFWQRWRGLTLRTHRRAPK